MATPETSTLDTQANAVAQRIEAGRLARFAEFNAHEAFLEQQKAHLAPELGSRGVSTLVELPTTPEAPVDRTFVKATLGELATGLAAGAAGGAPELREVADDRSYDQAEQLPRLEYSDTVDSVIEVVPTYEVPTHLAELADKQSRADLARMSLQTIQFDDSHAREVLSANVGENFEGSRVAV